MTGNYIYIVDTSAIIDLLKFYPEEIFINLHCKINQLIKSKRLISINEVHDEINRYERANSKSKEWCKKNKIIFISSHNRINIANQVVSSDDYQKKVQDIIKKYNNIVDPNKDRVEADPYLIALALYIKDLNRNILTNYINNQQNIIPCIVTIEGPSRSQNSKKIPDICKTENIECYSLLNMIEKEGWTF